MHRGGHFVHPRACAKGQGRGCLGSSPNIARCTSCQGVGFVSREKKNVLLAEKLLSGGDGFGSVKKKTNIISSEKKLGAKIFLGELKTLSSQLGANREYPSSPERVGIGD